jgi:hypothetical protein
MTEIGPQDKCVQCGESKAAIRESQRKGGQHILYCATVDYYGECAEDWDRHRFTWTAKDQAAQDAEDAHWTALADAIEAEEAAQKTQHPAPANPPENTAQRSNQNSHSGPTTEIAEKPENK